MVAASNPTPDPRALLKDHLVPHIPPGYRAILIIFDEGPCVPGVSSETPVSMAATSAGFDVPDILRSVADMAEKMGPNRD